MRFTPLFVFFFCLSNTLLAQNIDDRLQQLNASLDSLRNRQILVLSQIESVKLEKARMDLLPLLPALLPGEELVTHSLMALVYAEQYEQPKWVAHLITPDIINGIVGRTNDFRPDPLVKTGSAEERDYFLKKTLTDSTITYDAFGYDRGHLAPSADFRWSEKALSESYFYSNMSPQLPEFNRGIWSELEGALRAYIYRNPTSQLCVVTGPVLRNDLPVIPRSINQVSIPEKFWKVALDLKQKRAIGFVIPNQVAAYPLASFAVSIDEVEQLSGIDFFPVLEDSLENRLEKQVNKGLWLVPTAAGDTEPIVGSTLPPGHFNTVQARLYMGRSEDFRVVGKVVSTRVSRKGNIIMNLDQQYPNEIFSLFIRKEDLVNFPYDPIATWKNKMVVVKGKILNLSGTPTMYLSRDQQMREYGPSGK